MKKGLLFLVCCLGLMNSKGQTTWCPAGAEWWYHYAIQTEEGYVHHRYVNDTIVENRSCHALEGTKYRANYMWGNGIQLDTSNVETLYTYSSGDTVFFYYNDINKWLPLHYFGSHVGDTISVDAPFSWSPNPDSVKLAIIDSTGNVNIGGQNLRYYVFHMNAHCSGFGIFKGKVIERLGMMDNDIIPFWHCVTDDYYYDLCSYQDNAMPLYPTNALCRFIINDVAEIENRKAFTLSPNPAANQVTITVDQSMIGNTATITDITGKRITAIQLQTINHKLETTNLANGIYFVTLGNTTRKLIVSK